MKKVEERNTSWLFIAPLENLELTEHVNGELKLCKITLISSKKLPYVRKRLGFKKRISELRDKKNFADQFFKNKTFAVTRLTGEGKTLEKDFVNLVKKELDILSLSQLGYSRRRINSNPNIDFGASKGRRYILLYDTVEAGYSLRSKRTGKYMPLTLEGRWKSFQKKSFFFELLRLLRKEIIVNKSWRDTIERAAILGGQSQYNNNITQSFLWNMIALEILLTVQGDKFQEKLPERVEAFIGWALEGRSNNIETQIRDVYQKRCQIVHKGKINSITTSDLLFTDTLLLNVFHNILKNLNYFNSKNKLIEFSKKIQAKKVLNVKKKVGPKNLRYLNPIYSEKDYDIT